MQLDVTELRNGTCFIENGTPFSVIKYSHIKMARGGATIKVKVKNLLSGAIVERAFNSGTRVEKADISKKTCSYLYQDKNNFIFMDKDTFEQIWIEEDKVGEDKYFLVEGNDIIVMFYNNKPIAIDLPPNVTLKVTYAEKGEKGDTQGTTLKPVEVETGLTVLVPLFLKIGDLIKVDTRTKQYVERVN